MTALTTTAPSSLTTTAPSSLTTIADEIRREHRAAQEHQRQSVAHAIRCGELLIEAKRGILHGEWSAWLAANVKFSDTAARGYMRLAGIDEAKRQRVADMTLRQALNEIAKNDRRQQTREREAQREPAPKPGRIIDVQVEPAAPAAISIVVPVIEPATPEPNVEPAAPVIVPTAPEPRAHVADADEVQAIVDQIKANLSDADLLRVAVVALEEINKRGIRGGNVSYVAFDSILSALRVRASAMRKRAEAAARKAAKVAA